MRSGFVSILGRPNAGKSTLLNALTGEKVAIVTNKPQTTQTRILGILELPAKAGKHEAAQIAFIDTPGVHKAGSRLSRRMMQQVSSAMEQSDVVILMVDASRRIDLPSSAESPAANEPGERRSSALERNEDALAFSLLRKLDCPVFLVINKIDLIAKDRLLPLIQRLQALHKFAETIPISARKKDGLDRLVTKLIENLPQGQRYFPKDQFTDQPERFMVAELIRERILMETGQEIPYASAVSIERFEEPDMHSVSKATRIAAAIYCERPSQKAILIGKGRSKLKNIGTAARSQIEALLGRRVHLDLYVAVEENWRNSEGFLDTQDWRKQFAEMAAAQADAGKFESDHHASLKHAPRKKPSPKAAARGKRDAGL